MIITITFIYIWQCKHNLAWFLLLSPKKQASASLCNVHDFRLPVGADQDAPLSVFINPVRRGGWSTFPEYGIVILLIIYEGNEFWQWEGCPPQPPVSTGPWPNGIIILLVPILIKHLSKWHERLRQGEKYYYSPKIESRAPLCTVCVFYFWFHDKCV